MIDTNEIRSTLNDLVETCKDGEKASGRPPTPYETSKSAPCSWNMRNSVRSWPPSYSMKCLN